MFHLFSIAVIGIVLIYTIESTVVEKFISGKITHVGSNSIDKNSQVEVSLEDVTLMDVASKLIASTTISDAKTFPISYKLKYKPSDIKPYRTYAVSTRITGPDNKLIFINDVRTRVDLTRSTTSSTTDIAVIRTGESSTSSVTKLNDKKVCAPFKCPGKPKICPYGYQKKDGCNICVCNDPCNPPGKPILCGHNQRCFIDKKPDGTFSTRCDVAPSKKGKGGKGGKGGKSISSKADCSLPKVGGPCRAALPRFYYNSATKNCEQFTYGGCAGNGNNFHTKVQCETTCKA